ACRTTPPALTITSYGREATDGGANPSRSRSIVRRPGHRSISRGPRSGAPLTQAVRGSPSRASRGATSGSPANCELAVTVTPPTAVGGSVPDWRGGAGGGPPHPPPPGAPNPRAPPAAPPPARGPPPARRPPAG